jgi:ATP-dependent Clp protease ATP-binding subunit ClpA
MFLVDLEEELRKRVIGQDEAIAAISRAVKRSRVGLKDPDRPIAAMLFCGPTGVGKTELTKALARSYFGSVRPQTIPHERFWLKSNFKDSFSSLYVLAILI